MRFLACTLFFSFAVAFGLGQQIDVAPKPAFELVAEAEDHVNLIIKQGGVSFTLKGVFQSVIPSEKWSADELYHPQSHRLIVPMADLSYHLFELSAQGLELVEIIEGGVRGTVRGTYQRGRGHWHFTGWKSKDTLNFYASVDAEADKDSVIRALVNVAEHTYTCSNHGGREVISLRGLDESRHLETHFREVIYGSPNKSH